MSGDRISLKELRERTEWTNCALGCDHDGPFRVGYGDQWTEYDNRTDAWDAHVLRGYSLGCSWLQARDHTAALARFKDYEGTQ